MLDKITTNFPNNLFILDGVLRTFTDAETTRTRAGALDATAVVVLNSLNTFRRTVELINKGTIEQASSAPLPSTPAVLDAASMSDYRSLPDYCPLNSTLLKNNPRLLKAEWTGKPRDMSNDQDIHLLHEAEDKLAATLRLSCAAYLYTKRKVFEARLQALCVGKEFRKTDAHQVCRIDANKASRL